MSELTSIFATMIRELHRLYCEVCGETTPHTMKKEGRIEKYKCVKCSCTQEYTTS